jgi:beta-lactamase regulating signal transducer with metallopeptidase domain
MSVEIAAMLASPVVTTAVLLLPHSALAPAEDQARALSTPETMSTGTRSETFSIHTVRGRVDTWLPFVVLVWSAGVSLLLVRMAGGLWLVRRLQVLSLAQAASAWQVAGERLASRLGLRVAIHVVESARVVAPTAIGWLRPVILLPVAALANLTPSQVEAILAHELVHIRRHDYVVNVLETLAEILLFYHPCVWWVSERIRLEREHCCDDVVVDVCGDAVDYATALAELEAWRSQGTSVALAATGGSLADRRRRVLGTPAGHEPRSLSWVLTLGLTILIVIGVGRHLPLFDPNPAAAVSSTQRTEPIASPDTFDWQVFRTDHFDVHYYPAGEQDLERVETAAKRAYQWVTSELTYYLPFRVPLVLFKTRSEFEQQGVAPGASLEWVTSFSEPRRNRIVLLIDDEGTEMYYRLAHELTHIFMFDIIPRSSTRSAVPVWIDEGFADYMTGVWSPTDLAYLRAMVVAGNVPRLTTLTSGSGFSDVRLAVNLGHAAFEFIEAKYGKASHKQFLFEVRRTVVDGAGDLYQAAFNMTPDEFDAAFAQYLRVRFSP